MNIQQHLLSASAALVMTTATFAGIGVYAAHLGNSGAAPAIVASATPPANTRAISYNAVDPELPTVTAAEHHQRTA